MLGYYARLALLGMRRTPGLTGLTVVTVALGIGVFMAALTVFYQMAADPIAHKSDRLYAVQLDSWDPAEPFNDDRADLPPWELTWRDAMALRDSDVPVRQAAMHKVSLVVQPARHEIKPFEALGRLTDGDFFGLFDLRFVHGGAWQRGADDAGERLVVISRAMNDRLFGGEDSVGRTLILDDEEFRVVGVTEDWQPMPKFYDVNNGPFDESEEIFIPMGVGRQMEMYSAGNTNCWKDEDIGSYEQFINSECVWWQYWVELDNPAQREAYAAFLDGYVAEQKTLGRFGRPMNNRITPVPEWLELRRVVRNDNKVLVGLSFLFLAVCLFNTVGLMLSKFLGKAPQVGIRRALGARRGAVFGQQLVEVGAIGLGGGILGLGFALLFLAGAKRLFPGLEALGELDLVLVGIAIASAVFTTVLAGLYPAWRVCRVAPAHYLRLQ